MTGIYVIGDAKVFFGVTLVLGGLAAFASGRSVARGWRPPALLALYAVPLAFATRFLHWSLFGEPIFAPAPALIAYSYALAVEGLGWRLAHDALVRRQYPWLAAATAILEENNG